MVHQLITAHDIQIDAGTEDISDVQTTRTIQPGDFATVVRQNCNKYEEVRRKNCQKKKGITGESVQENNTIKGVAKKAVVCVNHLELGTTIDDVTRHLNVNGVSVISCFELKSVNNSKPHSFTPMRLCVPYAHLKRVYDSNLWPLGIVVRPWTFKSSDRQSTHDAVMC